MHLIRRFRLQALFCSLLLLACALISSPYTTTGICDDGPYILVAKNLAATGHIHYNGWSAAMLCWQLYLGAAFIKLFGFSFTTVRSCTLLVSLAAAFLLQRTLVRCGISERNATIGTLALVLSPLYLLLSVTFMSDIHGLFAVIACLYGCLRALQSSDDCASIAWLSLAIAIDALCGTSRQLAWLGVLVMLPSALWLLRARRRVLIGGTAATLAGVLFILASMLWLKHQPYTLPEHLLGHNIRLGYVLHQFIRFFLDLPFLILPIAALFLLALRKSKPSIIAAVVGLVAIFLLLATVPNHFHSTFSSLLDPPLGDWVTISGGYGSLMGTPLVFLHLPARILFTIVSLGGLLALIAELLHSRGISTAKQISPGATWPQLAVLFTPFCITYTLLLVSRAISIGHLFDMVVLDRYALGLLLVAIICLVRYYQEQMQPQLPLTAALLVAIMAIYAVAVTHNMFAFYRARVAIADELRAHGIPETAIDNGWDYNVIVELQHARYINDSEIENPPGAYVPAPTHSTSACPTLWLDKTPHIQPIYGISFDPNRCFGRAPFAPVSFSRWLARQPGILYAVRYTPPPTS